MTELRSYTFPRRGNRHGDPPEVTAWIALCDAVYSAGLRLVGATQGGVAVRFEPNDLGTTLTAVVAVEPAELRPTPPPTAFGHAIWRDRP